ncbi:hypothetical protein PMAYCL1PPCAC_27814, partial [Pristionchus mayeri]
NRLFLNLLLLLILLFLLLYFFIVRLRYVRVLHNSSSVVRRGDGELATFLADGAAHSSATIGAQPKASRALVLLTVTEDHCEATRKKLSPLVVCEVQVRMPADSLHLHFTLRLLLLEDRRSPLRSSSRSLHILRYLRLLLSSIHLS